MKKRFIILSLCTLIGLSGCNNNTSSSSTQTSSSSSIIETIIGVDIAGPKTCIVGKTIRLVADVLGSTNDDVIWSVDNNEIASINEEGVLTGLNEGEVNVTATSVKDPSMFKTTKITVNYLKAEELFISIEENDFITYDEKSKTYSIPLGQTFYVNSTFKENTKIPSVSYSVIYPTGTSEDTTVSLELIENTTNAKVIAYAAMEGLVIKATGKYDDLATGDLINSVKINIIDINSENFVNVSNTINSFKENENTSLLSSKIHRTKEVTYKTENRASKEEHIIEHSSYLNSAYVNKTTLVNNEKTSEKKYYQGINTIDMKDYYYTFEYDNNDKITNIYTPTNNKENISLMFDVNTSITYGHVGLLNNLLGNTNTIFDGSVATLGNIYLYAYANYELSNNSIKITSSCFDEDYKINYTFEFILNYNNTSITNYTINETIETDSYTINYKEEANEFVYGSKVMDTSATNENYLDINKYYMQSFEVKEFNEKDPNGAYDYSNKDKFGADIVSSENGLTKYIASYDKAIVLKVNALTPNTANVNIDNVKLESSDTSKIPSATSFKDGIFAINAKKDDNGKSLPGKATFTFKSTLGVEVKIVIEFTKTVLKSVNANFGNNGPTYVNSKNAYVFKSIYVDKYSDYFFINTDPDEDSYEFAIDIIEGSKTGIELHQFDETNPYGYPGFSYGIKGIETGTYRFKIYVKDYNIYDSKTFEITILEPITSSVIEKNIVGKSYEYKGFSTITSIFKFTSNNTISYTETHVDKVVTSSFNYSIEDGSIVINEIQSFTKGSYFGRINKGVIEFSDDFKSISVHLEIYSENQLEGTSFFQYYTYEEYIEPISENAIYDYINNKTFFDDSNLIEVSFSNGKGTLKYYDYEGNLVAIFEFDYTYNPTLKNIVISNTTSTNPNYSLLESDYVFDYYNQCLEFKINNNTYDYYDKYFINLA